MLIAYESFGYMILICINQNQQFSSTGKSLMVE